MDNKLDIRTSTYEALRRITGRPGPKRFLLRKLLDKKNTKYSAMIIGELTDADYQVMLNLQGPYGFTVYRALLVQHGLEDEDYVPSNYDL